MRRRSNAGMNAMLEAIKMGYKDLYCIGMDFMVEEYCESNVYDGSNAYGPETRARAIDTKHRVNYFEWFANRFNNTTFTFMFPRENLTFRQLTAPNVKGRFFN
jgi:hypothetical protein